VYNHQTPWKIVNFTAAFSALKTRGGVESVDLRPASREVHIHLTHEDLSAWPCARVRRALQALRPSARKAWRHLDTCQFRTILHAEPPRAQCPTHGVRVAKLPLGRTVQPLHRAV
jgi:hypothetical protein